MIVAGIQYTSYARISNTVIMKNKSKPTARFIKPYRDPATKCTWSRFLWNGRYVIKVTNKFYIYTYILMTFCRYKLNIFIGERGEESSSYNTFILLKWYKCYNFCIFFMFVCVIGTRIDYDKNTVFKDQCGWQNEVSLTTICLNVFLFKSFSFLSTKEHVCWKCECEPLTTVL